MFLIELIVTTTVFFIYLFIFFQEVVKVLLKYKPDVNKPLNAGKNKNTPLMLCAAQGNLEMTRLVHKAGGLVEGKGNTNVQIIKVDRDIVTVILNMEYTKA